ncbi:type II toxin-antitoxin system RatA family toxin [Yunchengibacter salinarum]|uniref:type II toxin-antitoxin system RatA family toxin n=1 Tax=Yunchengibacter salinarum TaxID=3133399 RepID=UPI0035B64C7D
MPRHRQRQHLPYNREDLCAMVGDVRRYPEFLPWCLGARVYNARPDRFDADLIIGFKMFREKFTSRVYTQCPDRIYVDYIRGPMKYLYNDWRFIAQDDGSTVIDFEVDFQFKSRLLEKAIGDVFTKATNRMVDAFRTRADALFADQQKAAD